MEGLEISELSLGEVLKSAETLRFDSDFYAKDYLRIAQLIEQRSDEFIKFDNLKLVVDGSAFYPALEPYYNTGNYPFLRVGDVKQYVDFGGCVKIPQSILPDFPTLKSVKKGDIVLTKGGTIGNAGLITQDACVSRDLIFINSSVLPEHEYVSLYLFFRSDFAYKQLVRSSSQSVQPHLTITLVRNLDIFRFSELFKRKLSSLYELATQTQEGSKVAYIRAENLLLDSLGLDAATLAELQAPSQTVNANVKSFANSFLSSGRLDSEFYQTKYDAIYEIIERSNPEQIVRLKDILQFLTNGQTPLHHDLSIGEVPFLTAEHVFDFRINYDSDKRITLEQHLKFRKTAFKKNDVLVTIKGRVGNAAVVDEENVGFFNINQDVALLQLMPGIHPHYVAGFINSPIGKLLTERISTGQINPFLGLGNLENLLIPIYTNSNALGEQIKTVVNEARQTADKSKYLLDLAKRAIEIAIEEGEEQAMALIDSQEY
ncbi:hypothetical protein GCM10028807_09370 [Spirosoma daeguense]